MFAAALPVTTQQLVLGMGVLFAVVFSLLLVLSALSGFGLGLGVLFLLAVIAACFGVVLPMTWANLRAQARRKRVEEQFPVALDVFVRALRSGHPIAAAIDLLTQELEDPIGSEFGIVADEVAYGSDLTDALQAMADRWDNADMRMFVVSLAVQKETGGNLAEILENLAGVIRQRAVMYMKVRALSSEGRLTGVMLTVLPIISLLGMFLVNPAFYLDTARDPIFIIGFGALILLFLGGVYWIRRLIDLKV
jgi:tight adherence protein B